MRLKTLIFMVLFSIVPISSSFVFADDNDLSQMKYGLSAMNSWNNCTRCSSVSGLNYTDDQINQLDTQLRLAGMSKQFKYFDTAVYNTDMIEDLNGGQDNLYADNVELYALSSHGSAGTNNGSQTYIATMCNAPSSNTCNAVSTQMVMGEQSSTSYGLLHPGKMRWLILATCYSMHTQPDQQWDMVHRYGGDMFMGYRNTSADSEYTDEVLADFAESAFRGQSKFKRVWFSATEDWYIDDTSEIMNCNGSNVGITLSDAENRLNNYTRTWTKRLNDGSLRICTWSWHEG